MDTSRSRIAAGLFAISLLAGVNLGTDQAAAFGAGAEGIAPGGAQRGYAIGVVVDRKDETTAKRDAVDECKKYGNRAAQDRCHVVATFKDQCMAVVQDPKLERLELDGPSEPAKRRLAQKLSVGAKALPGRIAKLFARIISSIAMALQRVRSS